MIKHHIITFFIYFGWSFGGFILHILSKLMNAYKTKEKFKPSIFWEMNRFQYLYSLVAVILICGLLAVSPSQIKELPPVNVMGINLSYQFWLIVIGYSGGSVLKNALKKKTNNDTV